LRQDSPADHRHGLEVIEGLLAGYGMALGLDFYGDPQEPLDLLV
jgi:hypothetical protein